MTQKKTQPRYSKEYFRKQGRAGGKAVKKKYGREYYRKLALKRWHKAAK